MTAAARAETIKRRTAARKQREAEEAAIAAEEAAIASRSVVVEEVFEPTRSETIIRRFEKRAAKSGTVKTKEKAKTAAPPSPLVAAVPVADIPPLAEPAPVRLVPRPDRDDVYVPLRDRWRAKVAADHAANGAA